MKTKKWKDVEHAMFSPEEIAEAEEAAKTELARIQESMDPSAMIAQVVSAALAPRTPSPIEAAHSSIVYLRSILDTAERAKALGWDDVFKYCQDRAREYVKMPMTDVDVPQG